MNAMYKKIDNEVRLYFPYLHFDYFLLTCSVTSSEVLTVMNWSVKKHTFDKTTCKQFW